MKNLNSKVIDRIVKSVRNGKSYDHAVLKIMIPLQVFFIVLITVASHFSKRQDINFQETGIVFILSSFLLYPVIGITLKLTESSNFKTALTHLLLESWEFAYLHVSRQPHTSKFYTNPASVFLIAIALKADGYAEDAFELIEKASIVTPKIKSLYARETNLTAEDIRFLLEVWRSH